MCTSACWGAAIKNVSVVEQQVKLNNIYLITVKCVG